MKNKYFDYLAIGKFSYTKSKTIKNISCYDFDRQFDVRNSLFTSLFWRKGSNEHHCVRKQIFCF